jgi:predicted RNA binding protein YcfA (HicA-like mRNA interferase family)
MLTYVILRSSIKRVGEVKTSELIKLLKKASCYRIRSGGNHDIWYSPVTGRSFVVPRHGAKEIKTGTAESTMKDAGLK